MKKNILCILFLSLIGCSSNSQTAKIDYIDSKVDANNDLVIKFNANKDFGDRENNESGSYIFCLLKDPEEMTLSNYVPNFESKALQGIIPRNEPAIYNSATKQYEYEVVLMKTIEFDLSSYNDLISCRVFTGKLMGGFYKSNEIKVINKYVHK